MALCSRSLGAHLHQTSCKECLRDGSLRLTVRGIARSRRHVSPARLWTAIGFAAVAVRALNLASYASPASQHQCGPALKSKSNSLSLACVSERRQGLDQFFLFVAGHCVDWRGRELQERERKGDHGRPAQWWRAFFGIPFVSDCLLLFCLAHIFWPLSSSPLALFHSLSITTHHEPTCLPFLPLPL